MSESENSPQVFDAIVVGAGFSGLAMLHRLRKLGLSVRVLEAGSAVGGTWYWNRYPGARCDIESMEYSYQFSESLQQDWDWSERHATQPEILAYVNHVAERFDLRPDIAFDTKVVSARFDETATRWSVETEQGLQLSARFLILATGCLSNANMPQFPGQEQFEGTIYHTGKWPHEGVDFSGQRVGVIGTGSSGIQAIPLIAKQAEQLFVFQRTANYTIPAGNAPLEAAFCEDIKANYPQFRELNNQRPGGFGSRNTVATQTTLEASAQQRHDDFEYRWTHGGFGFLSGFTDLWSNPEANVIAADYVRNKIRTIVHDPEVAELLCPKQVIGCKRICLDTGYYDTFNRTNTRLVDVKTAPITALSRTGLITADESFEVDSIVCATGFDAMTGALLRIDIEGVGGTSLQDAWRAGPVTYLGLGIAGFPNLFPIAGPGSPSVLSNMLVSIEQHVNWVGECVRHLHEQGLVRIEASAEAQQNWVSHANEVAAESLYTSCNSWYLGSNIPGKPRIFMPYVGGVPAYIQKCEDVVANGYEGFMLS
jgi:cation diffusion facilitator CzcD-associated flavoprotein CzcO